MMADSEDEEEQAVADTPHHTGLHLSSRNLSRISIGKQHLESAVKKVELR